MSRRKIISQGESEAIAIVVIYLTIIGSIFWAICKIVEIIVANIVTIGMVLGLSIAIAAFLYCAYRYCLDAIAIENVKKAPSKVEYERSANLPIKKTIIDRHLPMIEGCQCPYCTNQPMSIKTWLWYIFAIYIHHK